MFPTITAGARLASLLNSAIDDKITDDKSRSDVIQEMATAASISPGTVNQILNASINCPPLNRLRGFSRVLSPSFASMQSAAENDGCEYNSNGEAKNCILSQNFKNMNWLNIVNKSNKIVEVNIDGVIGGSFFFEGVTMEQVNTDLKDMKAIEADTILVNITNSPGGSILHGLGIIDILNEHKANKKVHILGMAASMASAISMVAPKQDRTMTPNSWFLIHELEGQAQGRIKNIESQIEFFKKNEKKLVDLYTEGTENDAQKIRDWMAENDGKGTFWTAKETRDNGFIGKAEGSEPVSMAAFAGNVDNLPDLPTNLVKTTDNNNQNVNVVNSLIEGFKSLISEFKNKSQEDGNIDKQKLSDLETQLTSQLEKIKNKYESQISEFNNIVSKKDSTIAQLNIDLAKAKGIETPTDSKQDPDPSTTMTEGFASKVISKVNPSQRRQLKQNKETLNKT